MSPLYFSHVHHLLSVLQDGEKRKKQSTEQKVTALQQELGIEPGKAVDLWSNWGLG